MAQTTTKSRTNDQQQAAPAQPVARLAPSRMPIVPSLATEFDVTADQWRVLVDQIFPNAKTVEVIGMALAYCRARKLDIFKRVVHVVPMWSTALGKMVETVWPGIAEIRTTAHRTGQYVGIDKVVWGDVVERVFEFEFEREDRSKGTRTETIYYPESAEVTVYRLVHGIKAAFTAEVFWEEAYAKASRDTDYPNEMWRKRSRGQLAKCVEAAALRMAFPEELGNTYAAEEMEGRTIDAAPAATVAIPTKPSDSMPEPPEDEPPPNKEPGPMPQSSQEGGGAAEQGAIAGAASDTSRSEPTVSHKDAASTDTGFDNGRDHPVANPATGEAMTNTKPAPNMDAYWTRLDEELSAIEGEDEFNQAWTDMRVEEFFAGNAAALDKAESVRRTHLKRIEGIQRKDAIAAGQGDLLGGDLPDVPEDE